MTTTAPEPRSDDEAVNPDRDTRGDQDNATESDESRGAAPEAPEGPAASRSDG